MNSIDRVAELLERNAEWADVSGPKDEELVAKAEQYLDLKLPNSYRDFLRRWGTLSVGPDEFYGVIDEDFETSSVPDAVWFTAKKRRELQLPHELVPVFNADGDEYYCLDTSRMDDSHECPVVTWDVSGRRVVEQRAPTFGDFLWARVSDLVV
jgi:hypothetical protein